MEQNCQTPSMQVNNAVNGNGVSELSMMFSRKSDGRAWREHGGGQMPETRLTAEDASISCRQEADDAFKRVVKC